MRTRVVIAMLVILACAALLSIRRRAELGAEFEAIGSDVGARGLPKRVRHKPTGMVLVLILPGQFTIGSPPSEEDRDGDEQQREVEMESAFYLGETEVTVTVWKQIMGTVPREFQDDELPASGVSWHQARVFIDRMNQLGERGWRLPSEAEWEYACRAGTQTPFSFGDNITPEQVNYNGRYPYAGGERGLRRDRPIPVRSLPPNPWGLYEMHGNVWEWCEDLYQMHPEREAPAMDTAGMPRVIRGGAWTSKGKQIRSAYRDGYPPASSGPKYGFRLAKSLIR